MDRRPHPRKKRYVLTTHSHHPFAIYPNLVPRLVLNGMNQLWVADITYIRLFPVYRLEFASQHWLGTGQHRDREDAQRSITNFIQQVYNGKRLHSALRYVSPAQFKAELQNKEAATRQLTR